MSESLQYKFHARVDSKRYFNRVKNPFIITKERRLTDLVVKEIKSSDVIMLEVGCGEGSNYHYLSERLPNLKYTGLDISKEKVVFFNDHFHGARAVCGDAISLPFGPSSFDVILCRDIMHHVDFARERMISEAMRVLRPQGKILILESNGKTLLNRLFMKLYPVERGMINSSPDQVMSLCSLFGQVKITSIEASLLVRGVGFVLGWSQGIERYIKFPLYLFASMWEKFIEVIIPKSRWTYLMYCIEKR